MHPGLCKLFKFIFESEDEDIDLIERAGYYYSQLQHNLEGLRDSFDEMRYTIKDVNLKDGNPDLEFNTLSIIYGKPAESFIKSYDYLLMQRNKDENAKINVDEEEEDEDEEGEESGTNGDPQSKPDDGQNEEEINDLEEDAEEKTPQEAGRSIINFK